MFKKNCVEKFISSYLMASLSMNEGPVLWGRGVCVALLRLTMVTAAVISRWGIGSNGMTSTLQIQLSEIPVFSIYRIIN